MPTVKATIFNQSGINVSSLSGSGGTGSSAPAQNWVIFSGVTTGYLVFSDIPQAGIMTLIGNTLFSGSGYARGREYELFLRGDIILDTLTFPSWTWVGGIPVDLNSGKGMWINAKCIGTGERDVYATYASQL